MGVAMIAVPDYLLCDAALLRSLPVCDAFPGCAPVGLATVVACLHVNHVLPSCMRAGGKAESLGTASTVQGAFVPPRHPAANCVVGATRKPA